VQYRVLSRGLCAHPDGDAEALAEYLCLSTRLAPLAAQWAERDERFRSIAACFPGMLPAACTAKACPAHGGQHALGRRRLSCAER